LAPRFQRLTNGKIGKGMTTWCPNFNLLDWDLDTCHPLADVRWVVEAFCVVL